MDRRQFMGVISSSLLAVPCAAEAQQTAKVPRVGLLLFGSAGGDLSRAGIGLREGLRELGYVEGRSIFLDIRFGEGDPNRLAILAAELVRERVDVIVAGGTLATEAARRATTTIPIVMAAASDPEGAGFIQSVARPGGNITGLSLLGHQLWPKRLELLKDATPQTSRVAVLYMEGPSARRGLKLMDEVAPRLSLSLVPVPLRAPNDLEAAFAEIGRRRVDAVVVQPNPIMDELRASIARSALKHRLPTMFALREYVDAGGLMSYAADLVALQRRAALYLDKILKGAKPNDLPVEQPTKFELIVNLRTAKALGLTIPQSLLLRADEVIHGREGPLKKRQIQNLFDQYAKAAGISGRSVHSLRHSIAVHGQNAFTCLFPLRRIHRCLSRLTGDIRS